MDLHPTPEHDEIVESAAAYLASELPAARAPKLTEPSLTGGEWAGLAAMGWFSMGLPEADGGLGLGVVESALVAREFGRQLVPPQAVATMLAVQLAWRLGDRELTEALAAGAQRAALAAPVREAGPAGPSAHGYRLVDTHRADVAIGWSHGGAFLAPMDAFASRVVAPSLDAALEVCVADGLDRAQARWSAEPASSFLPQAQVLTAAVLVGGAEACRDLSAEYAKTRHQFSRPIGSFQAIAHPCADMAVACEAALSCLLYAAVCVRDGAPERDLYSASARSVAYHAAYGNAAASMQVHGGYGQTYEYLPHFYLKRAMIYGLVGGGVEADEAAVLQAASLT
ncbi:MAG: acyl-CoA/acyl-ACP dehydrogenase [Caulobacteraceae bacterium]|nr:acyl-CoA/acyl-ACP dehydrogenase [Caulobacteraceae bacterium]